uniref:ATP synthase subunit a n=1 Tax=Callionymus reticulatus TaxID=508552 RepID=A0A7G8QC21_9TELE|nr:ATP synthase F0 subunit 6 [Callionymus reticulatus]
MLSNLFSQFESPNLGAVPLIAIALILPWAFISLTSDKWLANRLITTQTQFIYQMLSQLFTPLNFTSHKWGMFYLALLMFLITNNTLGLLPYTFTPTTQLSMNLAFALPFWMTTIIIGFKNQPHATLAHLLPEGAPTALNPALIVIETISLIIRPIALAVRLTANLTAGHLLIQLLTTGAFILMSSFPLVSGAIGVVTLLLMLLEMAVAVIQAYVFVLLMSLYLEENS